MPDFKVKFDMTDYLDIAPKEQNREYLKHDFVLNYKEYEKGHIEKCIWKRHEPTLAELSSPEWRMIEMKRILKTGVLIAIKDEVLWLPGSYYLALQYGKVGEMDLEFRLKRLKNVYEKIRARNNPNCKATLVLKNRADGETTMAINDAMWEMMDGNSNVINIGIQSKTRSDAINPCWSTAQVFWQSYPQWIKDELYSDFASGDNIAEKMKFMRSADPVTGKSARNITFQYYPCVYNAMDGKHNMKRCILDEICKWVEAEFYDTFTNYSKFIMPGFQRRGIMDMFSSPADVPTKSNEQVYELWKESDTNDMQPNGTTKSRVHRIYSNPLEGIQGAYDMWGDADPERIYDWIMAERKATPKDKLQGEIRAYPLNEMEMFDSPDSAAVWSNVPGIKARTIYLLGTRFKDEKTQEPARLYGNLEWKDGVRDTEVEFRMSDHTAFDIHEARVAITDLPQNREILLYDNNGIPIPPKLSQSCLGIDPIDKRHAKPGARGFSNAGMVNWVFNDIYQTGRSKYPNLLYSCRPQHAEVFFEDAIKAAVFCRSMVQTESINSKIIDYFEDRGYMKWLLSKRGQPRNSLIKGDSPGGSKNIFLTEIISLIDAVTNTPINTEDKYLLEQFWFPELLEDLLRFNPKDTHLNDCTMSLGQSLMGSVKLLHRKVREKSEINDGVLAYLLD